MDMTNVLIESPGKTTKPGAIFRYSLVVNMPYSPDYEKVHDAIAGALVESLRDFGVSVVIVSENSCVTVEDMGRVN